MDNKTSIITIVIVAILVVAGVAAAVVMTNGDDDDNNKEVANLECKLRAYGNANMDNYLDQNDVSFINDIVSGTTVWDRTANPLADANADGDVTAADATLVQSFLDGKAGTMKYMDWNNGISEVQYPLTDALKGDGGIYTMFSSGIDMAIILGIYDEVTYMSNGDFGPGDLDTAMYPNAQKNIKSCDLRLTGDTYEALVKGNVKVCLLDEKFYGETFANAVDGDKDYGMNVVKLPLNREMSGIDWTDTLVTLGAMMNLQSKTADYIDFLENVTSKIDSAVTDSGLSSKTYVMPYTAPGYTTEPTYVDTRGTSSTVMGDVVALEMLPLKSAITVAAASGYDETSVENIIALNPDIIVVSSFGYAAGDYTQEQYQKSFEDIAKVYVNAGYTGQIFGVAFETFGSLPGAASILVLASEIWSDGFDSGEAWDLMYQYYDKFTNFDGSLDDLKSSKMAPMLYSSS